LYTDLGDFKYIGVTEDSLNIDLRSGLEVQKQVIDHEIQFKELSNNQYHGAEFTFAVYFKFYYDPFPQEVKEDWLQWQFDQFQETYPEVQISKIEMYKVKRDLKFVNNEPVVLDSVSLLMEKKIKQ
jgi:hypothetical protein